MFLTTTKEQIYIEMHRVRRAATGGRTWPVGDGSDFDLLKYVTFGRAQFAIDGQEFKSAGSDTHAFLHQAGFQRELMPCSVLRLAGRENGRWNAIRSRTIFFGAPSFFLLLSQVTYRFCLGRWQTKRKLT